MVTFLAREVVVIQTTTLSLSEEEPVRHSIPMSAMERKEMMWDKTSSGIRRRWFGRETMLRPQ